MNCLDSGLVLIGSFGIYIKSFDHGRTRIEVFNNDEEVLLLVFTSDTREVVALHN